MNGINIFTFLYVQSNIKRNIYRLIISFLIENNVLMLYIEKYRL